MELILSICFGLWFLIGAVFYGIMTKVKNENQVLSSKKRGG